MTPEERKAWIAQASRLRAEREARTAAAQATAAKQQAPTPVTGTPTGGGQPERPTVQQAAPPPNLPPAGGTTIERRSTSWPTLEESIDYGMNPDTAPVKVEGATPMNQLRQAGQTADDAARVFSGAAGNVAAGTMDPNTTIADQAALTDAARQRLRMSNGALPPGAGEGLTASNWNASSTNPTGAIGTAGDIAPYLVAPEAMLATPIKAMFTGAGIGVSDTVLGRLDRGQPLNANLEEYLMSGLGSAAAGFGGFHLGKLTSWLTAKVGQIDQGLTKVAQDSQIRNTNLFEAGQKQMKDSNVILKKQSAAKFLMDLETKLGKIPGVTFSPDTTKVAWAAIGELRSRVRRGMDIPLTEFEAVRQRVLDGIYTKSGLLKTEFNKADLQAMNVIKDAMTGFVETLPRKFGLAKGKLTKGVEGWRLMDKYHRRMQQSERIAELTVAAEKKASGGVAAGSRADPFEKVFQDEVAAMFRGDIKKHFTEKLFDKPQLKILESISKGNVSQKAFNGLERMIGGGVIGRVIRTLRSTHNTLSQNEITMFKAKKLIESASDTKIPKRIMPKAVSTIAAEEAAEPSRRLTRSAKGTGGTRGLGQ